MIDDPLGALDYQEAGKGPTLVLVPGSCSTGAAWRPLIAALNGRVRTVTTSLPGYGGSAERRSSEDAGIERVAEAVEAVVARAGGTVHLVGHSFGGLTSLAVALRGNVPLASLAILEAPAPSILGACGEGECYAMFRAMTDAYESAYASGQKEAIAAMVDFYGGPGTFASWPERVQAYAIATTPANLLDWMSAYSFALTPAALAELTIPVLVAYGALSHPAVRRTNVLVGESVPSGATHAVAGAAHFMISTHPEEVAGLIEDHVERAARASLV